MKRPKRLAIGKGASSVTPLAKMLLVTSGLSFLRFFKTGAQFALFQLMGASPSPHEPSEMKGSISAITNSLSTFRCILWAEMDLYGLSCTGAALRVPCSPKLVMTVGFVCFLERDGCGGVCFPK